MSDYSDLKYIIAKNITAFRKARNMTQADVARELNYTDKAISKWERAESIPDISTLKLLADLYGVSLDDIITEKTENSIKTPPKISNILRSHKLIIPFLSAGIVWLIATVVFVFLEIFSNVPKPWLAFVYAVPVSMIVLLVFNAIWGNKILSAIIISIMIWSIPLTIVMSVSFENSWMLFLIPVPLQLLVVLWYIMKIKKK